MTVTVHDAHKLGKRTGAKGIVILEFTGTTYRFVSYADTKDNRDRLGIWLRELKDHIEAGLIVAPWTAP